jgi:hypothetical protein
MSDLAARIAVILTALQLKTTDFGTRPPGNDLGCRRSPTLIVLGIGYLLFKHQW